MVIDLGHVDLCRPEGRYKNIDRVIAGSPRVTSVKRSYQSRSIRYILIGDVYG